MPGSTSGVQTFVNRELPIGVAGDFYGANIRASVVAGAFAWLASPAGVNVGAMGWCNPSTGLVSSYFQPNCVPGLIHRTAAQTIIATFLGIATAQIPGGFEVEPMAQGDFLALFQNGATQGQVVYANPTTGVLTAGASGASVTITGGTITLTSAGLLTVAGTPSGTIAVGQIVVAAGIPAGTFVASLGTGSGGTGTYNVANLDGTPLAAVGAGATATFYGVQQAGPYNVVSNPIADPAFTAALAPTTGLAGFSVLTVSAVGSGTIIPGQWLYSTGATPIALGANVKIESQLTGTTGSTGTYLVSGTFTIASQAFNSTQGKIGKISSWSF